MGRSPVGRILERLVIEAIAAEGFCIAHHGEKVVFVPFAAPGDVVDVRVTKARRKYFEARVERWHERAPERVEPFCPHFGTCGGCKWQHVPYAMQLACKRQQVIDQFQRIGKFAFPTVRPTLPSPQTERYRNKLEYTFTSRRWLTETEIQAAEPSERRGAGFHMPGRFDRVLDIEACFLQDDISNRIRRTLKHFAIAQNYPFYDPSAHTGFLRNAMVRTTQTGEVMAVVQFAEPNQGAIAATLDCLVATCPELTSLYYTVNTKKNDTLYDLDLHCYAGAPHIIERLGALRFRIGPQSFFQPNTLQAERLYATAAEFAELTGNELVYDLYCGTGTISCYLATRSRAVVGIESIPAAIEDARHNAARNGIANVNFVLGDVKEVLTPGFVTEVGRPQIAIVDPPRVGMDERVVRTLLDLAPQRIVYVSCNPATQARDLAILTERYAIAAVQPVDMFPHTHHVENIVALSLL